MARDFQIAPRTLDCRGLSSRLDRCATKAISLRSAVLVERYSTNLLAIGLSWTVVHRLKAEASTKTKSRTGGVKMLMGFEQDATDAAEAQVVRSGIVPVLPSEAEVEHHELTQLPFRNWCRQALRTCQRQGELTP